MAHAHQGGEAPERSRVAAMFDDDSRYSGNLFVDTDLVTPMKCLWPVPGSRLPRFDTIMRIMPGKRDDGRWSAFRTGTGKGEYGRWIYSAWSVRGVGDPAITFFLCTDADVQDRNYDPRQHPMYILYNEIFYAVDTAHKDVKAHWAPMVSSKQRKVIKKPGPMFLVQALVYGRGGKIYDPPMGVDDGEKLVCFDLASDGGKILRQLLDERRMRGDHESAPPDPWNYADYYKYGDITAFDAGKFVQIYPAGNNPNRDAPAQAAQGPRRSLSRASVEESRSRTHRTDDDGREKIGYGLTIHDQYEGWQPNIEPDLAAALEEKIHPWPDIVKVPDHKTAASYMWSRVRFGGELKLDVILHAWRDHPDWLPPKDSDVWGEWVGRQQVAVGPYDPDAGEEGDGRGGYAESDRRPRPRAEDAAERAEDMPRRVARRAGAPLPEDAEAPPARASRMVERQEAVAQDEQKPAGRPAGGDAIVAERAAPDAAARAASFRPSAAAADEEEEDQVEDQGGGAFVEPPFAQAGSPRAAHGEVDPKELLAQARAKFAGGGT